MYGALSGNGWAKAAAQTATQLQMEISFTFIFKRGSYSVYSALFLNGWRLVGDTIGLHFVFIRYGTPVG